MVKLSELIAEGKDIHLFNGRDKKIVMKRTKDGWASLKDSGSNSTGAKKGTSKPVLLKEDPVRYIKKLY
jgi:hypothetical protein